MPDYPHIHLNTIILTRRLSMRLPFLCSFILLAALAPHSHAMSFIPKSAKNVTRVAVGAKDWVFKNPKTTAGVAVAPVVGVVAAPLVLGAAGFTAGGVAAGEHICSYRRDIFSILTDLRQSGRRHTSWHRQRRRGQHLLGADERGCRRRKFSGRAGYHWGCSGRSCRWNCVYFREEGQGR